jgi:hypothetical protein
VTALDVSFRYGTVPGEAVMRALDSVREVYGIRRLQFDEKTRAVRVEFDASRLSEEIVARLLRQAGLDIREKLAQA